ncbi:flavin monoamine oxidase family protein [Mucilaginibacter aquatilis]|uniref:Tryptophan 2-monooxygenase n=1 Tax=Mucilaginibacter aquatilis TaxID=1517760 RepID=A0A6I4I3F8_9SPHI|nr:NAD(P)/FAD-dependent oxidoreductase [Mucilaginibacter aquatilis]MVN89571.1 FAD-dependent oxidoreductase [Mucilaginibacter aquatilis]
MENTDVLIIGAGAAGLMAAYTLSKAGKKVVVLEACNRTGGRIHTLHNASFFNHAELGAEFVHGDLPVTSDLLKKAQLTYHAASGQMWHYSNGQFKQENDITEGWDELIEQLHNLEHDLPLNEFLQQYFPDESHQKLCESVRRYAAGYDTADPEKLSAFAMRNEWESEDDSAQYRIDNGYCSLINYLTGEIKHSGGQIFLNAAVNQVTWNTGTVNIITTDGDTYEAEKVILAIPLGVWQASPKAKGKITIQPEIPNHYAALQKLGFGSIVKILLQFDEAFWENVDVSAPLGGKLDNAMFLFSDEKVPTWWTQLPQHSSLLTGWLGGPAAVKLSGYTNQQIMHEAVASLAHIFNYDVEVLKDKLLTWHVANWTAEPYVYGSYAYDTVHTTESLKLLNKPIDSTLYFAGEFMYQGPSMGTVEAALTSGRDVAEHMLL